LLFLSALPCDVASSKARSSGSLVVGSFDARLSVSLGMGLSFAHCPRCWYSKRLFGTGTIKKSLEILRERERESRQPSPHSHSTINRFFNLSSGFVFVGYAHTATTVLGLAFIAIVLGFALTTVGHVKATQADPFNFL
jgi:hypothetical protein